MLRDDGEGWRVDRPIQIVSNGPDVSHWGLPGVTFYWTSDTLEPEDDGAELWDHYLLSLTNYHSVMVHLARRGRAFHFTSVNGHEKSQLTTSSDSCRRFSCSVVGPGNTDALLSLRIVPIVCTSFASEVRARLLSMLISSTGLSPLFRELDPSPAVEIRTPELRRRNCRCPSVSDPVTDATDVHLDTERRSGAD